MPIIATAGEKKEFHLVPAGTYQAVCYDVWDLGFQRNEKYQKTQHKIVIAWEIDETIPDGQYAGKRFTKSKQYTLSLGDKATLCKDLTSWRGKAFTEDEKKGFDVEKLIGVNCMISIIHNTNGDKTYANIATVSKAPKNAPPMVPENARSIPQWIKDIQAKAVSPEDEENGGEPPVQEAGTEEETTPF